MDRGSGRDSSFSTEHTRITTRSARLISSPCIAPPFWQDQKAHTTLLDVGNVLGLSNSLLRVISQRQSGDKMLVYGGMLLTTLLLGYVAGWISLGTAFWVLLLFAAWQLRAR